MPDLSEAYYDAVKNAVYNVWCVGYKNQKADQNTTLNQAVQ
jgi:hypothetical protein